MSVQFKQDTVFGEKSAVETLDNGSGQNYNRRMSRRGSVLNSSAAPPPTGVLVNSDRAYSVVAETLPDFTDLHDEMRENTEKETSLGFFGGLKTYPSAAAWSILLSSSIIMEGYDTNLLGSFFAFPQFNRDFGKQLPNGEYQVDASWQAGLMNGAQAGSMLGLFINGIMCDYIGYRKTYYFALVVMIGAIFLPFFANGSIPILMAGQVISGVPWGKQYQTKTPEYSLTRDRNVPNSLGCICIRGLPCLSTRISYHVRQHLLGHWASAQQRSPARILELPRVLGIQNSIRTAMDFPSSHLHWSYICTRITLGKHGTILLFIAPLIESSGLFVTTNSSRRPKSSSDLCPRRRPKIHQQSQTRSPK